MIPNLALPVDHNLSSYTILSNISGENTDLEET